MAAYIGPKVNGTGIIFRVDARNIKSYQLNGSLTAYPTGETRNSNTTIGTDGFMVSNGTQMASFTATTLSTLTAITANVLVGPTYRKSGYALSMASTSTALYVPSARIDYLSSGTNTTAIGQVNAAYVSSSSIKIDYISSGTNTTAIGQVNAAYVSSSSIKIDYISSGTNTAAIGTFDLTTQLSSGTSLTSYILFNNTTTSINTDLAAYNPEYELSIYINSLGAVVRHKNSGINSTINCPLTGNKTMLTAVYRNVSSVATSPLSVFLDGILVGESTSSTGTSQFYDTGITLLGVNGTNYAQYGVGAVSLYDHELNTEDLTLINNIKGL